MASGLWESLGGMEGGDPPWFSSFRTREPWKFLCPPSSKRKYIRGLFFWASQHQFVHYMSQKRRKQGGRKRENGQLNLWFKVKRLLVRRHEWPMKINMDTQNSHVWKEIHLKKHKFGIYVRFRGGKWLEGPAQPWVLCSHADLLQEVTDFFQSVKNLGEKRQSSMAHGAVTYVWFKYRSIIVDVIPG